MSSSLNIPLATQIYPLQINYKYFNTIVVNYIKPPINFWSIHFLLSNSYIILKKKILLKIMLWNITW